MQILVIGGTAFLGRQFVEAARADNDVTIFHRGRTNPGLFEGVEEILGERDGGLDALKGRKFDAVIDTCGYFPRVVRQSAEALADAVDHYTFISSVSVYEDFDRAPLSEDAPVATLDDPTTEEITGDTYGPLKALSEDAVRDVFGDRALVIRPGLIVGPFDPSDRFTYWPRRVAKGGTVLAPGNPGRGTQFIDARDLADWMLLAAKNKTSGTFNATGPERPLPMGELLEACKRELNPDARIEWVDEEFLLQHDVGPWMELPLWIPEGDSPGLNDVDISRALAEGLTFRPIAEIVRDTNTWISAQPERPPRAGLSEEKERAVLEAWTRASSGGDSAN